MTVYYIVIALISLNFILGQWLSWINHRSRNKPIPQQLDNIYSPERYQTYQKYKKVSYRFGRWTSFFSFAVTLFMVIYGFTALHSVLLKIQPELLRGLVFFAVIGFGSEMLSLPFSLYDVFVIEKKYGFTTITPRTFVLDKLKSWLLTIVLFGGLYSLIYWLYTVFGTDFWWMAWVLAAGIALFFGFFYSTLFVPIFNKQLPLPAGELRQRLEQLSQECGFIISNIFVIDGSKRSTRANAYFSGFGSKRRIVLYDTLTSKLDNEEIAAIVAHEIGHYRKRHIIYSMILSIVNMGIMFWIFSLIVGRPEIYHALGIEGKPFYIGIIMFGLLYSPVSITLSLAMNYISRRFEFQADGYAASYHYGQSLKSALKKLASDDLSDLTPHPAYVFVNYSHPSMIQRLSHLDEAGFN